MAAVEEHPDRQLYAEQVVIATQLLIQHLPKNDPLRQLLVEGRDLDPVMGQAG